MSTQNHYIDVASDHYKNLISYDFDTYELLIRQFLEDTKLTNERDILLFTGLLDNGIKGLKRFVEYDSTTNRYTLFDKNPRKKAGRNRIWELKFTPEEASQNPVVYGLAGIREANEHYGKQLKKAETETNESLHLLKSKLTKNSKVNLVEYVIDHTEDVIFDQWLNESCCNIFFNLYKSILVGEYLMLDDYSLTLSDTIAYENNDIEPRSRKISIESLKKSYQTNLSKIQLFCKTLTQILQDNTHDQQTISIDGYFNAFMSQCCVRQQSAEIWVNVLDNLLDVTYIDHVFVTIPENIKKLNLAFESLETLLKVKLDAASKEKLRNELYEPLKTKILVMLNQMINQSGSKDEELEVHYNFADNRIAKELKEIYRFSGELACSRWDEQFIYRNFRYDELAVQTERTYIDPGNRDISLFNQKTRDEFKQHRDLAAIQKAIGENGNRAFALIRERIKNNKFWTPPFLYKTIHYVYELHKRGKDDNTPTQREIYDLLIQLLNKLAIYITAHKNCMIAPQQVRCPFHMNFYQITNQTIGPMTVDPNKMVRNTVEVFDKRQAFMFLSLGIKPVNIPFLSAFLDKYKLKTEEILHDILKRELDRVTFNLKRSQDKQREQDKILKKHRTDWKEHTRSIRKELHNERTHTLQMLGLLGAFIAFVSIIATGIKGDIDPRIFQIYLATATICILIFILLFRIITAPHFLKWKTHKDYILFNLYSLFVLGWLAYYLIGICGNTPPAAAATNENRAKQETPMAEDRRTHTPSNIESDRNALEAVDFAVPDKPNPDRTATVSAGNPAEESHAATTGQIRSATNGLSDAPPVAEPEKKR